LFQEYAMFGEGTQVAAAYGLPGDGANFGLSSGGVPPEGALYGASMGSLLEQLLALQTAGFGSTNLSGPQAKLITAPVWDRFCDGWLATLTPAPNEIETYFPFAYQMMGYGDILRLYADPDFSTIFDPLVLLDMNLGNTNRLAKTSWLSVEAPEGGYNYLLTRASTSWGGAENYDTSLLYFLTLNPATLAPPPDPRLAEPTVFYDQEQGTLMGQSDWTTNRSQLEWRCSWISINHQNGDAGMFQFLRKREFLTKQYSGYDANDYGQCSWFQNTLALQNYCTAGTPDNLGWFEAGLWATGSQWQLGEGAGDPTQYASAGTNCVYTYGDMTPLYNRPSPYEPEDNAVDILQANRSLLWLKPDHIVVYDRATSLHPGLFKRFNLCLPAEPTVAPFSGGGSLVTETLADGQQLFINSLLPKDGFVTVASLSNAVTTVAEGEPDNYRIAIEDPNGPADIRFLHVLQGADAGAPGSPVTYLQSTGGNPFEGVAVRGAEVLFPVNVLSNNFTSLSYAAPAGVTNHYIAGLTPNARYAVTVRTNANQLQVTVAPGTRMTADSAGLLVFDNAGQPLQSSASQWTRVSQLGGGVELSGLGGPLLSYQVQVTTNLATPNWTTLGAATADTSGHIQYTDIPAPSTGTRFYRLAR
jgi:hypothetical protein